MFSKLIGTQQYKNHRHAMTISLVYRSCNNYTVMYSVWSLKISMFRTLHFPSQEIIGYNHIIGTMVWRLRERVSIVSQNIYRCCIDTLVVIKVNVTKDS